MESFVDIAAAFGVPDNLRPVIAPDAPSRGKLPIARALLPSPPRVQIALTYLLVGDPDPEVSQAATETLKGFPPRLVADAIGPDTHPKVLEFFAHHASDSAVLERVALQRQASDRTLCYLAETGSERIVEIIANNQERLLVAPEIFLHLRENPRAPRSVLDRVATFQRMCGIDLTRVELAAAPAAPAAPGALPTAPDEPAEVVPHGLDVDAPPLPPVVVDDLDGADPLAGILAEFGVYAEDDGAPGWGEPSPAPSAAPADAPRPVVEVNGEVLKNLTPLAGTSFTFGYDDGGEEWDEDLVTDHGDHVDDETISRIALKISKMSTGQKIKLAYVGNKEVRELLVRERNKMVATAVVKSGRLTEPEVARIAQNRSIVDDVLRLIASDREWLRRYPIKVALVNNPKCPLSVAVGLVSSLQVRDLKMLANNRNVSSVVFIAAQKTLRERKQV